MSIATLRPFSDLFRGLASKCISPKLSFHGFDICNPLKVHYHPFDSTCKCTDTLGADVTKFKSVQNTNFGRGQPGFGQNHKGHFECKINLDQVALVLNKVSKLKYFCDQLIFISLKALCYSYHQCRRSRRRR